MSRYRWLLVLSALCSLGWASSWEQLKTDAAQINTFQAPASPENPLLEEFYYFNTTEKTVHFRHEGNSNVLFVDGHAGSAAPELGSMDERLPEAHVGRLPGHLFPDSNR